MVALRYSVKVKFVSFAFNHVIVEVKLHLTFLWNRSVLIPKVSRLLGSSACRVKTVVMLLFAVLMNRLHRVRLARHVRREW